jgi:hypothetical protein
VNFDDLNHACRGLLLTAAEILNASGLRYVVAGGWVPLLSEQAHPNLTHPGTRDVDVLMMDEPNAVQSAATALLRAQFRPSAKHEFQLLRNAQVGVREFVFNVDLMHPNEADRRPEMFNDIFDLGVNDAYDPRGSRFLKSIAFKSAAIVYEQRLFSTAVVNGHDLDGRFRTVEVPILSPAAAILSKCESVAIAKRTRDAFDIYFILSGNNGRSHAAKLKQLSTEFPQVSAQLDSLKTFLSGSPDRYNENVSQHAGHQIETAASESLELLS